MENESGQFDDELYRRSWEMLIAAWHDWSEYQRKFFCWLAGMDYETIERARNEDKREY